MPFLRKQWVQAVLLLMLGGLIVALMVRKQDMASVWAEMRKADARFLLLAVVLSGIGHVLRAMRWRGLLQGAGYQVRTADAFAALMTGYMVNFAIPRLGELTRCAILLRLGKVPLLNSAGTVIAERAADVLMLGLLAVATIATAGPALSQALQEKAWQPLQETLSERGLVLLLGAIGFILLLVIGYLLFKSHPLRSPGSIVAKWQQQGKNGLLGIFRQPSWPAFLLQTFGIWLSYWSGPICTLLALDMMRPEWIGISFAMFTMGSLARTLPLPAGSMGPYHFLVSQVLIAFSFSPTQSLAAATLNHATQTFFFLLAGGISMLYLALRRPE